jgi:pSer/pThr/pTyr-binding forkhead associated (FHA) protein
MEWPGQSSKLVAVPGDIWLTFPDGTEHELHGTLTIGRGPENDLTLASSAVSRRHAALAFREGRWYVEDRGSYNGTSLNGTRSTRGRRRCQPRKPPSNEQIAAQLGTPGATGTVKAALRRIYAKAGLSGMPANAKRRPLCRVARQRGWI